VSAEHLLIQLTIRQQVVVCADRTCLCTSVYLLLLLQVSMSEAHDRPGSTNSWSRAPSIASSLHASSSSRPTTPRGSATAAAATGGGQLTLADVGSIGGRSWDGVPATTAASMLWEDMMEVCRV
jgi:hypothetical protein